MRYYHKLSVRVVGGVLALLLATSVFFHPLIYGLHYRHLMHALEVSTSVQARLVEHGIRQAMLTRNPHQVSEVVDSLAALEGVEAIQVLNNQGIVRAASRRVWVGRRLDPRDRACLTCHHLPSPPGTQSAVVRDEDGNEILRSVSVIRNSPRCFACHQRTETANGFLVMDFSLAPVRSALLSDLRWFLTLVVGMALLMTLFIGVFVDRTILQRLGRITSGMQALEKGRFLDPIVVRGKDEISQLASQFNRMSRSLRRSMEEVKTGEEFLSALMDSIEDGIVVVDRSNQIVSVNKAFARLVRRTKEQIHGRRCVSFIPVCGSRNHVCPAAEVFKTGNLQKAIQAIPGEGGKEVYLEIFASPLRHQGGKVQSVVEVWRDITERRALEAGLLQSEKLASQGLLALGVSHEINNPLTAIAACIEGLRERTGTPAHHSLLSRSDELQKYLEIISREVERCKAITHSFLLLAQPPRGFQDLVDVNKSVGETASLLEFEAHRRGVVVQLEFAPGLPPIKGDECQIRQVVLNLLLNAYQAIEGKGRVTVRTRKEEGGVRVEVEDTGRGIDAFLLSRIFEPFYTRRMDGRGTGLGLFIARSIVETHGGKIYAESQVDRGSKFIVLLPRICPVSD